MLKKIDPWFPRSHALRGAGLCGLLCGPRNDAERGLKNDAERDLKNDAERQGHCVPTQSMGTRLNHSGPLRSRFARFFTLHSSPFRLRRRGISLIEILISMFVMLFGLMGVAAIFPVGNHYVVEGEKFDLGAAIAQNAFEELGARGMLKPGRWITRPPNSTDNTPLSPESVMLPEGTFVHPFPDVPPDELWSELGPGHAFVIDPLGSTNANVAHFPYALQVFPSSNSNLWVKDRSIFGFSGPLYLSGSMWPVRRITLPQAGNIPLTTGVAETIFRLRDDLAVEQPDESDVPSIQRWDVDTSTTPNALLRRQYKGDYSWLATIVPTTRLGVEALQPSHEAYGEIPCDVSVVVFRKRDETPSDTSERFIFAELLSGGELVIYSHLTDAAQAEEHVDSAVDGIRSGNWIALTGINPITGDFVMKWYRILSLDDETEDIDILTLSASASGSVKKGRRAMVIGPDWPENPTGFAGSLITCILPDVFNVVTKQMKMEGSSLWSLE